MYVAYITENTCLSMFFLFEKEKDYIFPFPHLYTTYTYNSREKYVQTEHWFQGRMRSTEEFWSPRKDPNNLEDWLLSRSVTGSGSSFRRNNKAARRAKSEDRGSKVVQTDAFRGNKTKSGFFDSTEAKKGKGEGGGQVIPSEDSGNSSLNTSTTDSRRSRARQSQLLNTRQSLILDNRAA